MPSSKQPRKQRRARRDAPLHKKLKLMSAGLSAQLRSKLGTSRRSATVRKGDKVRVLTGSFKKKEGTVLEADYSSLRIYIEGVVKKTAKGQENLVPIDPSNVRIIDGDFSRKGRKEIIDRSKKAKAAEPAKSK